MLHFPCPNSTVGDVRQEGENRMSYKVTIVAQDGQETEIGVDTASTSVKEKEDGSLHVCVSWHLLALYENEPETVEVLKGLWPGEDRLILSSDESDVFWGNVTKVAYDEGDFIVEASSDMPPGEDDLTID